MVELLAVLNWVEAIMMVAWTMLFVNYIFLQCITPAELLEEEDESDNLLSVYLLYDDKV